MLGAGAGTRELRQAREGAVSGSSVQQSGGVAGRAGVLVQQRLREVTREGVVRIGARGRIALHCLVDVRDLLEEGSDGSKAPHAQADRDVACARCSGGQRDTLQPTTGQT